MEGREVYRHAVARMVESTRIALERAGLTADDLDLFVAHQANRRIVEAAAAQLGLDPEKVVLDVDRVANTSSASIPLALHRAEQEGRLRPGATAGHDCHYTRKPSAVLKESQAAHRHGRPV